MAGNLPVPQGLETKIVWAFNGNPYALNVFHWRNTSNAAITQTVANTIDSAAKTAFTTGGLAAQFVTGVTLVAVHTRSMIANSDPWFIGSGAAVAGTAVGKPLPAAVSLVVTVKTGLRGRSFNGRQYLTGWAELANDAAGGATAAASAAALGFFNAWFGAMAGGTPPFTPCVLSRWTTPAGSPPGTPPTERNPPILTSQTANVMQDLRWDTQRRRAIPGI